jgi:hypothetical protein
MAQKAEGIRDQKGPGESARAPFDLHHLREETQDLAELSVWDYAVLLD